MHIHNILRYLAKEIVTNKGEMDHLNLKQVRENAAKKRMSYNRIRINPQLTESEYLLNAVMKKIPVQGEQGSDIRFYNIVNIIEETTSNPPANSPHWQLPKRIENAEDYVALLVRQGLIQKLEDHCYYCPIPSLKSYVLENNFQPILKWSY